MATAFKRLKSEMREHIKARERLSPGEAEVLLRLKNKDLFRWECFIKGPKDSPFEGHFFEVRAHVSTTYPMVAPKFYFATRVFHPNVKFGSGEICVDILRSSWSPVWSIESVCRAIVLLLAHPEPNSPLNCDAGNLLRAEDLVGYESLVRMYCVEHAPLVAAFPAE